MKEISITDFALLQEVKAKHTMLIQNETLQEENKKLINQIKEIENKRKGLSSK